MLGLPIWAWVIIAAILVLMALVRSFYVRWRRMCRGVREDLTEIMTTKHPEVQVLREEMGNLVVRMPDGTERIWEMAEIYADVARLPGLGRDRNQREPIYHRAVATLLAPPADGPLSLEVHGPWIKPMLVPMSVAEQTPDALYTPIHQLDLAAIYVLDLPQGLRHLTEQDGDELGIGAEKLYPLALDNLGKDFPDEALQGPREGSGSAIQCNDAFNAARLLLLPKRLGPGDELVALIPHRDMVVLLPGSILEDREKLQQGINSLDCDNHPPLLKRAVRVTRGGFELI